MISTVCVLLSVLVVGTMAACGPICKMYCEYGFETGADGCPVCKCRSRPVNICRLPAETGPCKANMERYFFNHKTGDCEKFTYGGCQGNGNNFASYRDCSARCLMLKRDTCGPICLMLCEYGFETGDDGCPICKCRSRPVNICRLPAETGPCKANMERYFFNHKTGDCETFTYGGCQGNGNNFASYLECSARCLMAKRDIDVCSLDKETGPCEAYFPRYYYNKDRGQCEQFIYGGCRGNGNNFNTPEECAAACPSDDSAGSM